MRLPLLLATAGLALSACGDNQAAENTVNIDGTATADNIASNDTTAIDAATGADADMAADVEYNLEELNGLNEIEAGDNEADAAAGNEGA